LQNEKVNETETKKDFKPEAEVEDLLFFFEREDNVFK
jgi:hypothetical protein